MHLDFASVDVSFISLTKISGSGIQSAQDQTHRWYALIKPQFEAGKEKVGKKGVVERTVCTS